MHSIIHRAGRFGLAVVLSLGLLGLSALAKGDADITVHITKTGHKYHNAGCRYLRKSDIEVSLKTAKQMGLGPCSVCCPPQ
jgi:hypothetical protein